MTLNLSGNFAAKLCQQKIFESNDTIQTLKNKSGYLHGKNAGANILIHGWFVRII
jgi:hypothetical protein